PGLRALLRTGAFVWLARHRLQVHREPDAGWVHAAGFRTIASLVAVPTALPPELVSAAGGTLMEGAAAREIEPELGRVDFAIHLPNQGSIRPLAFAAQLAGRAGRVATRVRMHGIETVGGRVVRVRTSHGDV